MSFATWEYPLRADNPYTIMLGDMQSQRQLIGQGMRLGVSSVWPKVGTVSPTLGDVGPMVRWELWASPARLEEPLPSVGDKQWERLARKFAAALSRSQAPPGNAPRTRLLPHDGFNH